MTKAEQIRQEIKHWLGSGKSGIDSTLLNRIDSYLLSEDAVKSSFKSNELVDEVLHAASLLQDVSALVKLVKFYLSLGLELDQMDSQGTTLLHKVQELYLEGAIEELVECGASIDIKDRFGKTILHYAISEAVDTAVNNDETRLEEIGSSLLILSLGADLGVKDSGGNTPLDMMPERYRADFLNEVKSADISRNWVDTEAVVTEVKDKAIQFSYAFNDVQYSDNRQLNSFGLQGGPIQVGNKFTIKVNPKSPKECTFDIVHILQ